MRRQRLSCPTLRVGIDRPAKTQLVTGLTMLVVGLLIVASLAQSTPAQSKTLPQETPTLTTPNAVTSDPVSIQPSGQQSMTVNGRAVFAVPIVTGPQATAILQQVQTDDHAHVVHDFLGWGKSVSTRVGWFRCADIIQANEYRGSQVEVEAWFFLTDQERLEAQAACTL